MGNILESLGAFALSHATWTQVIIAVGILVQGEITILLAIHLITNHNLSWFTFASTAIAALLFGELLLYSVGRFLRTTRHGWLLERKIRDNRRIQFYTSYLHRNATKLITMAKFLLGVNFLVLILAGWSEMKFKKFFKAYLTGAIIWFTSVTFISYLLASGLNYLRSEKIFEKIELVIAGLIVLILFGEYLFKKIIRKEAEIEETAEKIGEFVEKNDQNGG